ncbi:hypothetical protein D3C87_1185250 [compost metagenome]
MTNKYLLFNVWDEPYRNATIWCCFAGNEHRDADWQPVYDDDPRFTILKSLSGWLECSGEYYSFKRYVLSREEYEAIAGVTA